MFGCVLFFLYEQLVCCDISKLPVKTAFLERPPGTEYSVYLICMRGWGGVAWKRVHGCQNMPFSFIDDSYSKQPACLMGHTRQL